MASIQEKDSQSDNSVKDSEEVVTCPYQRGYKVSIWKSLVFYPLAVLPCGVGLLMAYWFPHLWIRLTCSSCPLKTAHFVLVKDNSRWVVERVREFITVTDDDGQYEASDPLLVEHKCAVKYIVYKHLRYIYDDNKEKYILLRGYEVAYPCQELYTMSCGLHGDTQETRLAQYGPNIIDVPVKAYHVLFLEEVLHPFYIFQILSMIFWMVDTYYYYCGAVFLITTISLLASLIQTRRHMQQLHDMVTSTTTVSVLRDNKVHDNVCSTSLVPGDILIVPRQGLPLMPCDAVLLSGNVIVNESMLTGESVPITKTPLPREQVEYSPSHHKRHTLFCGTQIIQARYYSQGHVLALVVRTGFSTSKGGMVRSILFPKPLNIKFYWDSIKFILILSVLAAVAFVYTFLILKLRTRPYETKETILRAFDIITTIVPPSLPAAITVGTVYALNRLKKNKIYCISPQRVNLCGKIKCVCFDKTGTLTEDSLDLQGVQPASEKGFSPIVYDCSRLPYSPLLYAMATCHSLTYINGKLVGDPLDLKMFQATTWVLEEPDDGSTNYDNIQLTTAHPRGRENQQQQVEPSFRHPSPWEPPTREVPSDGDEDIKLGILKQFTFSSELQRMSVLVRVLPSEDSRLIHVLVKGAPEKIRELSDPSSIPEDFYETLGQLTQHGYRVLGVGFKTLHMAMHKAERLERDAVECDLKFCGFIIMENRLKPETRPTLMELQNAYIRTVMVTGDNLLTAVAVSQSSGMVAQHHRIVVIKAADDHALSYHVIGDHNVNHTLNHYSINNTREITDKRTLNIQTVDTLESQLPEYFHLAVDGHTFSIIKEHHPQLYERLLVSGTVFARMSPTQKAQLVTSLMDVGYGVAMCGDGANDCGALKAAHAGLSLSDTEASVASPFTSKTPNISCMPALIKEGRCALVTSFSVFKFMALYSLTEFTSVAILYAIESNLGDWEYLYVDLVLILAFAFVMGLTHPYPRLVRRRPPGTLAGIHVIVSVLTQALLMVAFQVGAFFYVQTEYWFIPLQPDDNSVNIVCWENTAVFTMSVFLYISLAVAFSTAAPYRRPLVTNKWFLATLAFLIPINLYITLAPGYWWPWFWRQLQVKPSPSILFRVTIVELAGVHFLLAYLLEGFIFPSPWALKLFRMIRCKKKSKNRFKHILKEIELDECWPPPLPNAKAAAHC